MDNDHSLSNKITLAASNSHDDDLIKLRSFIFIKFKKISTCAETVRHESNQQVDGVDPKHPPYPQRLKKNC